MINIENDHGQTKGCPICDGYINLVGQHKPTMDEIYGCENGCWTVEHRWPGEVKYTYNITPNITIVMLGDGPEMEVTILEHKQNLEKYISQARNYRTDVAAIERMKA